MRIFIIILLLASNVSAQEYRPEGFRGGWYADIAGVRHIYMLVQREMNLSGIYCTDCSDPANLAFLEGTVNAGDHANLAVISEHQEGSVERAELHLVLDNQILTISAAASTGSAQVANVKLQRMPFEYVAAAPEGGFVPQARPYQLPGTAVQISPEHFLGLWVAGNGPGKQYFIFRKIHDSYRGIACGPCNDPRNMAVLDDIRWQGETLYFNIIHEDSGPGFGDYGPHANVSEATIARNELHISVVPSFEEPDWLPVEMTLYGPLHYQP